MPYFKRNLPTLFHDEPKKEGGESVTKCNRLKMEAADGKKYLTAAADPKIFAGKKLDWNWKQKPDISGDEE
jgi:hypothetical protein